MGTKDNEMTIIEVSILCLVVLLCLFLWHPLFGITIPDFIRNFVIGGVLGGAGITILWRFNGRVTGRRQKRRYR